MSQLRKAVILGNSGFLGRALEAHLVGRGLEVHGYSSASLDLRDAKALAALDSVLDANSALFLLSGVTPDRGINLQSMADNVTIVTNVAGYLENHPVAKCTYLSTDAVYRGDSDHINESMPAEPGNLYSTAKYLGEQSLALVATQQSFPLLILRPAVVYGPGNTHSSYGPNQFVRTLVQEGVVRIFGEGEELRDHPYIDDVTRLTWELTRSQATGVFNLASGSARSFASVVETLCSIAPQPFEVVKLPRNGPVMHRRFDIEKLEQAVPGSSFTPFEDGLQVTFDTLAANREMRRDG